jgi:hypothetical protein
MCALVGTRGVVFKDIVFDIQCGDLDILEHPNRDRYAGLRIFVVQRDEYVYLVSFVEDADMVFLKTIIPSSKATKCTSARSPTMNLDADEKELLESVEGGVGSPPAGTNASWAAAGAATKRRSARNGGSVSVRRFAQEPLRHRLGPDFSRRHAALRFLLHSAILGAFTHRTGTQ